MKKLLAIAAGAVIFSCIAFSMTAIAEGSVSLGSLDGDGTEDDPYVITNVDELQAIEQDLNAHYVLANDIDASETEAWNAGGGFEPIGDFGEPFSGSLDGQRHTITGLIIDQSSNRAGLFGSVDGKVKYLNIEDAEVRTSGSRAGIAMGENLGEVERVYTSGTVESGEQIAGGLVGSAGEDGLITKSGSEATVSGDERIGGLIGEHRNNHLTVKSYAVGEVTAPNDERAGGLIGRHTNDAELRNSYSASTTSGGDVGGLVGHHRDEGHISDIYSAGEVSGQDDSIGGITGIVVSESFNNGYWDVEVTGQTEGGYGDDLSTGLETAEMTGAAAEANMDLDFENFWTATDEYPILEWQVQDVDLEVSQPAVGEGETTDVTVTLTLDDGSTVTASEVAEFDSETAVAEAEAGTLEANSVGETDLTATVAGESDTQTVEVLEPPSIELVDAEFDTETAVEGATVEATATYENTGGPGSETAVVTVGGEEVTSSVLEIDADGETTRTLSWEATEGGLVDLDGEELGELSTLEAGTVGLESIELPEEAAQDSEYDIDLELTNEADGPVTDTVELRIDGEHAADESVTVDGDGSTETITGSHDEQGTATHVVELHDTEETAMMEIVEPAEFTLEDLEAPETVAEGSEETFTATVRNVGGGEDEAEISLEVDGETVETKSTTLAVEETDTLEFEMPGETAGEVDVVVESPDDSLETALSVEADDGIPGFTASVVAVALVAVVSLVARRR